MCGGSYHDHHVSTSSAKVSRKQPVSKAFDPGPKQEEEEENKDEPEQGDQAGPAQTTSYKGAARRERELV